MCYNVLCYNGLLDTESGGIHTTLSIRKQEERVFLQFLSFVDRAASLINSKSIPASLAVSLCWNHFSADITSAPSLPVFNKRLETHPFKHPVV